MTSLFLKKRKKKESLKKKEKKMDWVGSSTLRVRFGTIYLVKTKIFAESTLNTKVMFGNNFCFLFSKTCF